MFDKNFDVCTLYFKKISNVPYSSLVISPEANYRDTIFTYLSCSIFKQTRVVLRLSNKRVIDSRQRNLSDVSNSRI